MCPSGSRGSACVLSVGSSKWQMQDGEMRGAIFFVQIRIGGLLSRKCSIWCRKLLFLFEQHMCPPADFSLVVLAQRLGASPALTSCFL